MRPISSSNVQASPVLFPLHVLLLQVKYKIPKERMFHIKFFIRITPSHHFKIFPSRMCTKPDSFLVLSVPSLLLKINIDICLHNETELRNPWTDWRQFSWLFTCTSVAGELNWEQIQQAVRVELELASKAHTFVGNCPPSPPLSEH